jgi:uncharacterized membrane protein
VTNYIEVGSENMQLGWIDFSKEDRQKPFIRVLAFRSILTFGFFAFNVLLTIKTASIQIGCFIIAVIVIYRHLIKHNNGPVRISILHQR